MLGAPFHLKYHVFYQLPANMRDTILAGQLSVYTSSDAISYLTSYDYNFIYTQ